jgi:hypothetical protein
VLQQARRLSWLRSYLLAVWRQCFFGMYDLDKLRVVLEQQQSQQHGTQKPRCCGSGALLDFQAVASYTAKLRSGPHFINDRRSRRRDLFKSTVRVSARTVPFELRLREFWGEVMTASPCY